jgi:hypothetical protein
MFLLLLTGYAFDRTFQSLFWIRLKKSSMVVDECVAFISAVMNDYLHWRIQINVVNSGL